MRSFTPLGSLCAAAVLALAAILAQADSAGAATLTLIADDADLVYDPGDTVTLRLVGDAEGATDDTLWAALLVDTSVFSDIAVQRFAPPSEIPWIMGGAPCRERTAGYSCPMMNAIHATGSGHSNPVTVQGLFTYGVLSATANYSGVYAFDFAATPSTQRIDFFGLTSAPGLTITVTGDVQPPPPIVLPPPPPHDPPHTDPPPVIPLPPTGSDPSPVPEPTSALLFAAGVALVRLRLRTS